MDSQHATLLVALCRYSVHSSDYTHCIIPVRYATTCTRIWSIIRSATMCAVYY